MTTPAKWEEQFTKKWYRMFENTPGGLNLEQLNKTHSFIHQLLSDYKSRLLSEVEGLKRKVEECDMSEDAHHCNSCDSMMSCEYAEQTRQYNQALTGILALIRKEN